MRKISFIMVGAFSALIAFFGIGAFCIGLALIAAAIKIQEKMEDYGD